VTKVSKVAVTKATKKYRPQCLAKQIPNRAREKRGKMQIPTIALILTLGGLAGLAYCYAPLAVVVLAVFVLVYFGLPTPQVQPLSAPTPSPVVDDDEDEGTETVSVPLEPAGGEVGGFGECDAVKPEDPVIPTIPVAANLHDGTVLENEDFAHPGSVDQMCAQQWFPSQQAQTFKEKQNQDFKIHRQMRRSTEWSATARWTEEDKAKYERARRRMESEIASVLRPDPYMVVERDPKQDNAVTSDQPFASINSDHTVFHTARFRTKAAGTGNLASYLKTKI
jgi:hypothetical protein